MSPLTSDILPKILRSARVSYEVLTFPSQRPLMALDAVMAASNSSEMPTDSVPGRKRFYLTTPTTWVEEDSLPLTRAACDRGS
jgi:hypothetical protein